MASVRAMVALNWCTARPTPTDLSHVPLWLPYSLQQGDGVWLRGQPAAQLLQQRWGVAVMGAGVGVGGTWEGFPNHPDWVRPVHIPLSPQPGELLAFDTI